MSDDDLLAAHESLLDALAESDGIARRLADALARHLAFAHPHECSTCCDDEECVEAVALLAEYEGRAAP